MEAQMVIFLYLANLFSSSADDEEGVANDSDSSPPQSRGRFEKGRTKVGSRGQSEDSRSTSSQAADEESSSHVRRCTVLDDSTQCARASERCAVCCSGTGRLFAAALETADSAVASATLERRRMKRGAYFIPITPKKWLRITDAWWVSVCVVTFNSVS